MIVPPATLGMLGGGQLGRMFVVAARTMGYRVAVLDPDAHSPAGDLADEHIAAPYDDLAALDRLSATCGAVSTEFENVPARSLERLALQCPVRPSAAAVAIAQDRLAEKTFLRERGFATAPFEHVASDLEVARVREQFDFPALLKTSRFGYDGKGQREVTQPADLVPAFAELGGQPCILEQFVELAREISVVLARGADGQVAAFPAVENVHRNGILDLTIAPARIEPMLAEAALAVASRLAGELDYCGVLGVEMFVLRDGRLLINEMAPRPHNSGHFTLDACRVSQFEQQVRALCGLPLGDPTQVAPAVMVNLLGDIWRAGEPNWRAVFRHREAHLHLYGKREARPGRKMGHVNVVADTLESALATAEAIRKDLGIV